MKALAYAEKACIGVHAPVALDLTVRTTNWPMPEDLRVTGSAFGPGRIDLGIDVSQKASDEDLYEATLRIVFHEFHHVLRWDGPGYGRSLGEALVSEGLAQCFVHEMMTCPPEPWEQAVDDETLDALVSDAIRAFDKTDYDHSEWFFGKGDYPNWSGYALGKRIADRYLEAHDNATALSCATVSAQKFRPFLG
ncbi:MAG: DUF2268 domain-containing protein [Cohaesibacter sp.]|nr:DUF2268 domain-containing protein [Cohaesibacter sp.]